MTVFPSLFVIWCSLLSFSWARDFQISAQRKAIGTNPITLGKSLYWFGNFSVGDTKSLDLLIDSGSSDLLINPGLYKPSANASPYKLDNFSITYEGVNRAGFGFETINGTLTRDDVSAAGLTVPDLPLGNIKTFQFKDARQQKKAIQGDGIIGFLGKASSSFDAPSWVYHLCHQQITRCRFGFAFGTSGKGLTIFGKLAKNLLKGDLTVAPLDNSQFAAWVVRGDVAIGDKIVFKNQTLIMDSGTDNIQGPYNQVKKIFDMLDYQTVERTGGANPFGGAKVKVVTGFFPCDKPPTVGFSIPAQSEIESGRSAATSKKSKLFNVSLKEWGVYDHGNNNCTSILGGTNALSDPKEHFNAWLVGQPFFSGHYVDFKISRSMGFADLKDPSMA